MDGVTVTETAGGGWWSQSSWFQGTPVDTTLCVSTSQDPIRVELPLQEDAGEDAESQQGKVGGAAAQNRFNGRTGIPIDTTPAGSANLPKAPATRLAAIGGAVTHSRFNDRKKPTGVTCDGSTPGVYRPGVPLFSRWQFDFECWEWKSSNDGEALCTRPGSTVQPNHSAIAGRRWGDGRDTLRAAVAAAAAAASTAGNADTEGGASPNKRARSATAPQQQQGSAGRVGTQPREQPATGFASIAGLARAKTALKESVVAPLRHPKAFKALGLPPCRGVLLHGPPGTGKTMLALALAEEARAHLELVDGSELVAGDDAPKRLEQAFETAARNAPSVLVIENIDVAAATSKEGRSESSRCAAARLTSAIDSLRSSGARVCVVGVTSRRGAICSGLTRAGRLDMCIPLGALDSQERVEVASWAVRAMPLAADIDLKEMAGRMRGYVAADVVGACHQAAVYAISEALTRLEADHRVSDPDAALEAALDAMAVDEPAMIGGSVGAADVIRACTDSADESAAAEGPGRVVVSCHHFERALSEAGPSMLRGLAPELPSLTWDDAGGLDEAKMALRDLIELPVKYAGVVSAFGLPHAKGALLYGPPGCGKTLLAKVVASCCGANFISVKGPELLDKWLGESERAVRSVFEAARAAAPCVLFMDELDALAPRRSAGGAGAAAAGDGAAARVVNQLLCEMDGISSNIGGGGPGGQSGTVFVVGATNRPEALDPALLRPGRLDHLIKVPLPDCQGREAALGALLRRTPLQPGIDLGALAEATEGFSGADLSGLVQTAVTLAVRELIAAEEQQWALQQKQKGHQAQQAEEASALLLPRHLEAALARSRRSVGDAEVVRYDEIEAALREGGGLDAFHQPAKPVKQEELQGLLTEVSERVLQSKAATMEKQLKVQEAKLLAMAAALRAAGLPVPGEGPEGEEGMQDA